MEVVFNKKKEKRRIKNLIKKFEEMEPKELNSYIDYELDLEEFRYMMLKLFKYELKELESEKVNNMKYYRGVKDYQGGSWGMYCQSISDWRKTAMDWCNSDENWRTYNALKYYKIKNEDLIDFIEDYWEIKLVPTSKELYLKYKDKCHIEDYEDDYWNYEEE